MKIYKATNQINGKVYIGQTIRTLKRRIIEHSKTHPNCNIHFHNAIKKYGVNNFRWQVICICPSIDSLNEREQYYIALYDSINSGYNLTTGGLNYIVSDEAKENMSKNNARGMLGKHHSDKTKEKIRQTILKNMTDETRQRMKEMAQGKNNGFYGKKHTTETIEKLREASLGRKHTKESIKKMSGKNHRGYGKHLSESTKKKIGDFHRGKIISVKTRKKMSQNNVGMLGKKHSEATKKKMRTAAHNHKNQDNA